MRIQLLERRVFIIVSAIVRFSGKVRGGFASKRQISIFAPVMALYARRRCLYQGAQTRHGHGLCEPSYPIPPPRELDCNAIRPTLPGSPPGLAPST